jgi:type IV pilus assembly protein PilA
MRKEKGFTLIELLVVIAIIGILAAIAIPQFAEYKTRAFNSRAQSDLRNGLTAEEAYFVDNERYATCNGGQCQTDLPGFVLSDGVTIDLVAGGDAFEEFSGGSCHARGDRDYTWASAGGSSNVMQNSDNGGSCDVTAPGVN